MEGPDFCERCGRGDGNLGGFRGRRGGSRGGVRGGGVRGGRRGRGRGRSRGGRGGSRGDGDEKKLVVDPHRHPGVFIARSNGDDMLVTRNMVVGESVYGEERISIDGENQDKIEYRVWNPFRSKLSAAIIGGIDNIYIQPGTKILYLGAANGTTVSHVSDIVGTEGLVYAVEVSHQSGGDLLNLAKTRTNIIPIIEDARHPHKYQMLVDTVDTIYADVAQPDQAHILAINAQHFMKNGGKFVITIKASCMDSKAAPEVVFADEIKKLRSEKFKPYEQITLEPFEQEHAVVVGVFQPMDKNKNEEERKEQ